MTINSLKELDKLMLLCKKRGIEKIKIDNIEFTIDATTEPKEYIAPLAATLPGVFDPTQGIRVDAPDIRTPDQLTEEQLLYYSANGQ